MRQSLFKQFASNKRGNIALLTALLAVPMLVLAGGAVDLMRIAGAKSEVLGAIDSGVLAATSLTNTRDPETVIREYIDTNVDSGIIDPATVNLTVSSSKGLNSSLITVKADFNISTMFVNLVGFHTVPVSVSSTGTESIPNVEVSLVLDVSGSMGGSKLTSMKAAAVAFVDEILTDATKDRTSISLIPYSSNVNLGATFASYLDPDSIDRDDVEDELCAGAGGGCDIDDFTQAEIDAAAIDIWNGCFDYDLADYSGNVLGSSGQDATQRNRDCKPSVTPIFVSNDATALKAQINSYSASGRTAMHVGTMWGYKALAPGWQGQIGASAAFPDRPKAFTDTDTRKFLVVMTDGKINPINADNGGSDVIAGNRFVSVCQQAQTDEVSVWAIGFQITPNDDADILLSQCPSNASQYFLIEDLDIASAFEVIAATINDLRLTM